jgi:DNA-binding response OmpR family regulator
MAEILFVEDDDAVRQLFAEALREAHFRVSERRRAEEALPELARAAPDVVILDLGMPPGTLSGTELLARLRETPGWRAVPVIILSGFGDVLNPDVAARLGVHQVFTKSQVTPRELVDAVRRALRPPRPGR